MKSTEFAKGVRIHKVRGKNKWIVVDHNEPQRLVDCDGGAYRDRRGKFFLIVPWVNHAPEKECPSLTAANKTRKEFLAEVEYLSNR